MCHKSTKAHNGLLSYHYKLLPWSVMNKQCVFVKQVTSFIVPSLGRVVHLVHCTQAASAAVERVFITLAISYFYTRVFMDRRLMLKSNINVSYRIIMLCRSLFVLLYYFFWSICCLFFFNIRILFTSLLSSNSSCTNVN